MNRRTAITVLVALATVTVALLTTRSLPFATAYAVVLVAACAGVFMGAFIGTVVTELWPNRRPWWRAQRHQEWREWGRRETVARRGR